MELMRTNLTSGGTKSHLDPTSILTAEFEYIAQTAFQANEDRARVSSFYFVSVGSFIAALFGSQSNLVSGRDLYWAFAILFASLGLYGLLTMLQLARLRLAWFDCVQAMNQIKAYYVEIHYDSELASADLSGAFRWTSATVPAKLKFNSISFLSAVQTAVLSGIMLGTSVMYFGLTYSSVSFGSAVTLGTAFFILLILLYVAILRSSHIARVQVDR